MKKSMTGVIALLAGAFAVHSQGTVSFGNYAYLSTYIYVNLGSIRLGGSSQNTTGNPYQDTANGNDWTVALYGAAGSNAPASSLEQLETVTGQPATATLENGVGDETPGTWWSNAIAEVPGTAGNGSAATVQIRAWYNDDGRYTTYDAALAAGLPTGFSTTANIITGGPNLSGPPSYPASLPAGMAGEKLGSIFFGPTMFGFNYAINADYTITITGYVGPGGAVTIPTNINGMPVTVVGDHAFDAFLGNTDPTSITFPYSITNIGSYVFNDCIDLIAIYFEGNAPAIASDTIYYDNLTAYYLPGTSGWSEFSSNTGVPTLLWRPRIDLDTTLGVQSNAFGFNVSWADNLTVVMEACTNLANPVWQPLETNTINGGAFYFIDPQRTNYPTRFYRVRGQ